MIQATLGDPSVMPSTGTTHKIRWTPEERDALVQQTHNILTKNAGMSMLEALRRAQDSGQSIKPDRRRILTALASVPWLEPALKKCNHSSPEPSHATQIVESVVMVPLHLQDLPMEDLIHELLLRILTRGGSDVLTRVTNQLSHDLQKVLAVHLHQHSQTTQTTNTSAVPLKKLLVIGLLPEQRNELSKEFDGLASISFWTEGEGVNSLKMRARTQDQILVMKKFISHAAQDVVRSVGMSYTVVPGAMSELKEYILHKVVF